MNYGSNTSSWKPWRWMRLDLIFSMWYIYINSNLSPLTKFTSSSRSTKFKDILPWGIIFLETEEGYKIWRDINLLFQNWQNEFDNIWPEHSKVWKAFILMGSFWAKYILFELKKYRGIIFHETEEGYKICRGIDLLLQNWHKEFDKIWPEHSKVSKIFILNELLLSKVYIVWAKKVQRNNLSWNWRGIQNLERNWLAVSKLE